MTPRDRRTDPIYNVCLICGQSGHCSASCTQGRCNAMLNGDRTAVTLPDRECNACDWRGSVMDCCWLGTVGPLCPECRETTTPSNAEIKP